MATPAERCIIIILWFNRCKPCLCQFTSGSGTQSRGRVRNGLFNQRRCGAWGTAVEERRARRPTAAHALPREGGAAGPGGGTRYVVGPTWYHGPWGRPGLLGPGRILSDLSRGATAVAGWDSHRPRASNGIQVPPLFSLPNKLNKLKFNKIYKKTLTFVI